MVEGKVVFKDSSKPNRTGGLVKSLDDVELLSIRRSSVDEWVRAKIRVKCGELGGQVFFTKQPKTEEAYSTKEFSPTDIEDMTRADLERDKKLSPRATVVSTLEDGKLQAIEPMRLLEPVQNKRYKLLQRSKAKS